MNYYERHLGDYAKDTAHLSMIEHGAYGLLLDRYYGTDAGIPEDKVYRIARARSKEERLAVDVVLSEFFTLINGVWINKRAEEEIAKARIKINTAKENGKKGGRPNKKNNFDDQSTEKTTTPNQKEKTQLNQCDDKPNWLFLGYENETQKKAHQTPVHQLTPPIPPKGGILSEKTGPITLKTFIANCRESGEKSIPEDDPVFEFADKIGIPDDWLRIAWREFSARYLDAPKRYKDWRKVFRNAVRGNWFKVWYMDENGRLCLTSQGRTLSQVHKEAA